VRHYAATRTARFRDAMNLIATVVLPVFGLIGIGYLVARLGILSDTRAEALSEFIFVIAIPLLILRIIVTADFSGTSAWQLWLPYFAGFVIVWATGTIVARRLFGRDARAGLVAGLAASYGNTTLIGIPLVLDAYGDAGSVPMALIVAVQFPAIMTAVALLMERAERRDNVAGGHTPITTTLVRTFVGNPIVIGLAVGVLWRLSGIPFAGLPATLISRIADVTTTLALFAVGMTLSRYGIRGNVRAAVLLAGLKLFVMPALVFVLARAIELPPIAFKVAVIAAACSTGVTPFLVAGRFRTGEGLASSVMTISTMFAVATVSFWLHAVEWV
jgi:malonate transporter and related proteins